MTSRLNGRSPASAARLAPERAPAPEALIARYYPPRTAGYRILMDHSRRVADKALTIADGLAHLNPDRQFIREAALLHDIGIFQTRAPSLGCRGAEPYIRHGVIGRRILEDHGLLSHGLVCERHVGVGISTADIVRQQLPLPLRDMRPQTLEEEIICYADLFFSKQEPGRPARSLAQVLRAIARFGDDKTAVVRAWARRFEGARGRAADSRFDTPGQFVYRSQISPMPCRQGAGSAFTSKENAMTTGESGMDLCETIKKAIRDCEISSSEYDEILAVANADSHIDAEEQRLLSQLQQLIANGTVKRVAG